MSSEEVHAIVLKTTPYREDDLLCDLFTLEKGRLLGLARSARKSRIRFGSVLTTANILKISLENKRGVSIVFLKEASLESPWVHLYGSLESLGVTLYFMELMRAFTFDGSSEPQKFHLLHHSLIALENGEEPSSVRTGFERHLLRLAGVLPYLQDCLRCHALEEQYYFVFQEGGLFCHNCLPAGSPFLTVSKDSLEDLFTPFLEYCIGRKIHSKTLCQKPPPKIVQEPVF
ncbi:MAG: DNA repair protein RecO [Deltaproteobacteria bacterium]|nr:DNA repair protein RecO [Deltaproteobacteria bacterium]